jgi:hypothetical protein
MEQVTLAMFELGRDSPFLSAMLLDHLLVRRLIIEPD